MKYSRRSAFFMIAGLVSCSCLSGSSRGASPPDPSGLYGQQPSGVASPSTARSSFVTIPGPLRSFLRMAAISQKVSPEEVIPLLSRNVVVSGYRGASPTEFLLLLNRYLGQAVELEELAGPAGVIRVSNCGEAQPLLEVIGYRFGKPCGPDTALEVADGNKAFMATDSGFPLAELEEALRTGKPFAYPYSATQVPILFTERDWVAVDRSGKNAKWGLVHLLLRDPDLARLYWALARMDPVTASALLQTPGLRSLLPHAAALDFYGSHIAIRSGHVMVPGGTAAEPAWRSLVGASPASPGQFIMRLVSDDEGWLAAYFDALSRISQSRQAYFTEPGRLQKFYGALRWRSASPSPTTHSFRPDQNLFLLVERLGWEANGQPHVPGTVETWKAVLRLKGDSKVSLDVSKRAKGWTTPQEVVEGMFTLARVGSTGGPLQDFLTLSQIDAGRPPEGRLSASTIRLLAERYPHFGDQYPIFSEFKGLNDASVTRFLASAEALDRIPDRMVRADALGIFQANVGLWQILARQGQISNAKVNESWQAVIGPFAGVRSSAQLFDTGRTSLEGLLRAAAGTSSLSQDEIIALLAGPEQTTPEGQQVRRDFADRMRRVMDDQRLVSLNTLLALGNGLNRIAEGGERTETLLPLNAELREFEMPRPLFTTRERAEYAAGLYSNRHTIVQMHTDLARVIKAPASASDLAAARGELTPFLRDVLVGFNYAYYEPPGAQMLHHNPLFVRSHDFSGGDFSGEHASAEDQTWRTPRLFGRGWTASGGAHLVGSLADLPYVLTQVEQDFIVPNNVQSLIWEDLVPGLIISSTVPRWWEVTRDELHAVALYQRAGEELLSASAKDENLRASVTSILAGRMLPQRLESVEEALRTGSLDDVLLQVTPAETLYLAAEFRKRFPGEADAWGAAGKELQDLIARNPSEVSWDRLSKDFGVPHPALEQTYSLELLNDKPFPAFMDYSSRLLAEWWDSNNLYWARLADEMGYAPVVLNLLAPELTRHMVEETFATHLEDWPAVLRAMRQTGEEFRQGKIASLPRSNAPPRI